MPAGSLSRLYPIAFSVMTAKDWSNIARCAGERWRAEVQYGVKGCIAIYSPRFEGEYHSYIWAMAQPAQRKLI